MIQYSEVYFDIKNKPISKIPFVLNNVTCDITFSYAHSLLEHFFLNNDLFVARTPTKSSYELETSEIKIRWEQLRAAEEKYPGIRGVFDVSVDTIVLLRHSLGIEVSSDRGMSWIWLAKDINRFNEFTIDDKGLMWGLELWIGIHEPSYCRMHSLQDKGKTWKSYELDAQKFFPMLFIQCHMLLYK
ncbi:MAG: hypothetical protein EOO43_21000 [Flavobacterium sp.]|nr:MAG: hypothetical protein EOO43_21000 [Flavobacterium sp.]